MNLVFSTPVRLTVLLTIMETFDSKMMSFCGFSLDDIWNLFQDIIYQATILTGK